MPHNITFVIDALTLGGAQRSLVSMANYWAEQGHAVQIIALKSTPPHPSLRLSPNIVVRTLGMTRGFGNNFVRLPLMLSRLRTLLTAPRSGTVFAFLDQVALLCLLASYGTSTRIIPCERGFPGSAFKKDWDVTGTWQSFAMWLRNQLYRRAAMVVVQTDRARQWFPKFLADTIVVIPNPCWPEPSGSIPPRHATLIVGVGRLSFEKGFDLLIDAFCAIAPDYPDWHLTLYGDGPEAVRLRAQAQQSPAGARIHFPGTTNEPVRMLRTATIFVLPSREEGFPVALMEALSAGCPIIAADCTAGPREILENGKTGRLFPALDSGALAQELRHLIGNPELRNELSDRAWKRSQSFGVTQIMGLWERLLAGDER